MTLASVIKTTGKSFRYVGQSMMHLQGFGFFVYPERPNPFYHLWDEDLLKNAILSDILSSGFASVIIGCLMNTIPFAMMGVLLIAPTIALVGLGLSYWGQKLEENCEANTQPSFA